LLFGISAGAAGGLDAVADQGNFAAVAAAAKSGAAAQEIDDMMFDAAVDAAIETGNAGALPGVYGPWWWLKSSK
jgi:hypothetical protein